MVREFEQLPSADRRGGWEEGEFSLKRFFENLSSTSYVTSAQYLVMPRREHENVGRKDYSASPLDTAASRVHALTREQPFFVFMPSSQPLPTIYRGLTHSCL